MRLSSPCFRRALVVLLFALQLGHFTISVLAFVYSTRCSDMYSLRLDQGDLSSSNMGLRSVGGLSVSFFIGACGFVDVPLAGTGTSSIRSGLWTSILFFLVPQHCSRWSSYPA